MTSFSFGITFDTLADKLNNTLASQPEKGGVIEIQVRGFRWVQVAHLAPGQQLASSYEETPAGLIVTRREYSEFIAYTDIFKVRAHTYTPYK